MTCTLYRGVALSQVVAVKQRVPAGLPNLHNPDRQRSHLWIFLPGPVESSHTELDVDGRPVPPPMLLFR
jgi:hypothetical protein